LKTHRERKRAASPLNPKEEQRKRKNKLKTRRERKEMEGMEGTEKGRKGIIRGHRHQGGATEHPRERWPAEVRARVTGIAWLAIVCSGSRRL